MLANMGEPQRLVSGISMWPSMLILTMMEEEEDAESLSGMRCDAMRRMGGWVDR